MVAAHSRPWSPRDRRREIQPFRVGGIRVGIAYSWLAIFLIALGGLAGREFATVLVGSNGATNGRGG